MIKISWPWALGKRQENERERIYLGDISPEIPDITGTRNLLERIASVPIGRKFGIATREGTKVFLCTGIQKPSDVKIKNK